MKVISRHLPATLDNLTKSVISNPDADLVLVYGNPFSLEEPMLLDTFKKSFPNACLAGCSSDGVIINGESFENSIIYSAIDFDNTEVRQARVNLPEDDCDEYSLGVTLATELVRDDLISVIIFIEGTKPDCHQLLEGVREVLGTSVSIWGGLASDKTGFDYTVVMDQDGVYDDGVVAVGLYGKHLVVDSVLSTHDQPGVKIEITRTEDNIIHEINDQPAAKELASILKDQFGLPMSSVLQCPIVNLNSETLKPDYARVVYYADDDKDALYAVATVNEGTAKLVNMVDPKDNLDDAVKTSMGLKADSAEFVLIASCAARKTSMKTDWINESAIVQKSLGDTPSFGFYAYGEIGKNHKDNHSILHNHTLSMITLYET